MGDKSHLKQDITLSKHEQQQQQQELRLLRRRRRQQQQHQQVTKNRFRLRAANRNSSATMAWATSAVAAAVPGTSYVSSTRQTRILDALRGSWFSTVLLLPGQNRRNNIVVATTFSTKTNINKNKWLVETAKGMMLLAAGDCSGQGGSGVSSGPKAIAPLAYASLTGCTSALLTFLAGCRQPLPPMQFLLL